jgi:hypothetical protein
MNYFNEGLAWDAYLIDPTTPGATTINQHYRYGEIQRKTLIKGGISEYVISLAGNYSNKLYMENIRIQTIRYVENSFILRQIHDSIPSFNKFDFQNDLNNRAGFVLKFD